MNASSVTEQVNRIKRRPNLLVWYTADEPDGTSDPLDATLKSSNLIQSLDGGDGKGGAGYHPVSLVLNCENYFFTYVIPPINLRMNQSPYKLMAIFREYTSGTDIVMQDTYMIGNNVTFSTQWGTVCTKDYGDCGFVHLVFSMWQLAFSLIHLTLLHLDVTIAMVDSKISPRGWMNLEIV